MTLVLSSEDFKKSVVDLAAKLRTQASRQLRKDALAKAARKRRAEQMRRWRAGKKLAREQKALDEMKSQQENEPTWAT